MRRTSIFALSCLFHSLVLALGLAACQGTQDGEEVRPALRTEGKRFTAWSPQALRSGATKAGTGEDCESSPCATGLCLHTKPGPGEGHVCAVECVDEDNCPEGWGCVSMGGSNRVCAPPRNWQPNAVKVGKPYHRPEPDFTDVQVGDAGAR